MLNKWQLLILKNYAGGEFEFLSRSDVLPSALANCGDGLLAFLINELDDAENSDDAWRRIHTVIREVTNLEDILHML